MTAKINLLCFLILSAAIVINSLCNFKLTNDLEEIKMAEKVQCPNCLEPAEKVGNKITCHACDSVLTVTRTGGAKVSEAGWKEQMEEQIKSNKDRIDGLLPEEPEPTAAELKEIAAADADGTFVLEDDDDEPILPE